MAFIRADRVKDTTTTTGTGAVTVSGTAPTGFRTFSAVCSTNDTIPYCIAGGAEWEVGIGTYSATNEITRTTILASSNGGSAVNFSAGTKDVFITKPAGRDVDSDQLASTAANLGASLVGVEDAGAYFADANVEDVLQAIGAVLDAIGPATWQIFTSSGTWTKPTGCKVVFAICVGGGGGGGGANTTSAGQTSSGVGGGSGACAIARVDVTALSTVNVTVGAGGAGGSGTNGIGAAGGASYFGASSGSAHATAGGGDGGNYTTASGSNLVSGVTAGGTATLGDILASGGVSGPSARNVTQCSGGAGGNGVFGGGGKGMFTTTTGDGSAGTLGGGGGGAANGPSQGSTATGGAGGSGVVIVLELY